MTSVERDTAHNRFTILVDGEPAGFTSYRPGVGKITFLHTEIDERYEGRGLGSTLVRGALDAARAEATLGKFRVRRY